MVSTGSTATAPRRSSGDTLWPPGAQNKYPLACYGINKHKRNYIKGLKLGFTGLTSSVDCVRLAGQAYRIMGNLNFQD